MLSFNSSHRRTSLTERFRNALLRLSLASVGTIALLTATDRSAIAQTRLTNNSRLALDGIGPIQVGMTIAEAQAATGMRFTPGHSFGSTPDWQCSYFTPVNGPEGLRLMVINGEIVRVDVAGDSRIETLSGAGIGDSQRSVVSLYPGQIEISLHPYIGRPPHNGRYLTYVPRDAADRAYSLIFETSRGEVRSFRSGFRDAVAAIEGCA